MPPTDRALRRLVLRLSRLDAEDLAEILAGMSPAERAEIERLLKDLSNGCTIAVSGAAATPVPAYDPTRMSPWLFERIENAGAMTPIAHAAIRNCATRFFPMPTQTAQRSVPAAAEPRRGLAARIASVLSSGRIER